MSIKHLDIKKLGHFECPGHRIAGNRQQDTHGAHQKYVHVVIDDNSREIFSTIFPDETKEGACRALLPAVRYYRSLSIRCIRVLTKAPIPIQAVPSPVLVSGAEAQALLVLSPQY